MPAGRTARRSRPLFVTRKFPPSVGGMETLAAGVWRALSSECQEARLVAHGGPNRQLVWWLPLAVLRTALALWRGQVDFVLTNDALTFAALSPVLRLAGVPAATMVMGLDLTFRNPLYRFVIRRTLPRAQAVLAISEATAEVARGLGVPAEHVSVVRLGVDAPPVSAEEREVAAARLRARLGLPPQTAVLLTVGRLVRRKGARWFVSAVLPRLGTDVVYAIAGEGPEAGAIATAAAASAAGDRVRLLGRVDEPTRDLLMAGADLFVQPNVRVPGDMEGFGLVVIEAVLRGSPVVGAALEGILDAVVDGETGLLLPPGDAEAWTRTLGDLLADRAALAARGQKYAAAARALYGHDRMATDLLDALDRLLEADVRARASGR